MNSAAESPLLSRDGGPDRREVAAAAHDLLTQQCRIVKVPDLVEGLLNRHQRWLRSWPRCRDYIRMRLREPCEPSLLFHDAKTDLVGLRRWLRFRLPLFPGLPMEHIRNKPVLQPDGRVAYWVGIETALRLPYMINKRQDGPKCHAARISKGGMVEWTVKLWIQDHWPQAYLDADNAGSYASYCAHDLKLVIFGKVKKVDVAGPSWQDEAGEPAYGAVAGKPRTDVDLHICARAINGDKEVIIDGWCYAQYFARGVPQFELESIERLVVRLNAEQDDVDLDGLTAAVRQRTRAHLSR